MTLLEAVDASTLRKSRRNSMIIMRAASQMNLNQQEETEKLVQNPSLLLSAVGQQSHHKEEHHQPLDGNDAMVMSVSALYGKLLVIMGMAFPIADAISSGVPLMFYNSFYLYLYFGSIFFVIYSYLFLLHDRLIPWSLSETFKELKMFLRPYKPNLPDFKLMQQIRNLLPRLNYSAPESDKSDREYESEEDKDVESNISESTNAQSTQNRRNSKFVFSEASHGSMYLKIGTVVFGIGSMIYSGLEFGQFFERKSDCSDLLMAITPVARMVFTFLQMYFIFLNSRVSISRNTIKARFGLMHMLATNLCVWVNVLVQETKHTMHHLSEHHGDHHEEHHDSHADHDDHDTHNDGYHSEDKYDHHHQDSPNSTLSKLVEDVTESIINSYGETFPANNVSGNFSTDVDSSLGLMSDSHFFLEPHMFNETIDHNLVRRAAAFDANCQVSNVLGDLVNTTAQFLFPCAIEYSLLCAGVIYVMWSNVINKSKLQRHRDQGSELSHMIAHKLRHHYSVDCARASRGLFLGIFILVLSIIGLTIFYVLIDEFKEYAILQANITEITIYSITIVTCIIGMVQMSELSYHAHEEVELDNILLLIAQAGVYIFNSFTIIGTYFDRELSSPLALVTSLFALTQATLQTLLILQGSQRSCWNPDQLDRKPGREVITFLLVCNLAMWAMSTFQTSRAQLHPNQLHFYGNVAWPIISHVSMPLAIFYRFHATVCLGEIWKKSYKMRAD